MTVTLDVDDEWVSAVYEYDGSGRLYAAVAFALVFGALAAAVGGTAGIGGAVGTGAIGFGIVLFWFGNGNLFITYSHLTTELKSSLREAVAASTPTKSTSE